MNAERTERRWNRGLHFLGFLASLSAAAGLAAAIYVPLQARETQLNLDQAAAWKLLNDSEAITKAHAEATAALAEAEQRIRRVHEQIPQQAEEGQFKSQLSELAARSDFEIVDYRPGSAEPHRFCEQIKVHVKGHGSYESVCHFLAGLDQLPRVCRATDVTIDASQSATNYNVDMTLMIYFAVRKESLDAIKDDKPDAKKK